MNHSETLSASNANNAFTFDLWAHLRTTPGNLVVSPASITSALVAILLGARGDTAAELKKALHLKDDVALIAAQWRALLAALENPGRASTLHIANRWFAEKSHRFDANSLEAMKVAQGAQLERLDFRNEPQRAREHINAWVEQRTAHRIKNLLSFEAISSETRLVLANAISFIAAWHSPFDAISTHTSDFWVLKTEVRAAPMMRQQAWVRIARADGFATLELRYAGGDASMIIVLPDAVDGLTAVEKSIDATQFTRMTGALRSADVLISLPRFLIDPADSIQLSRALEEMGVRCAFDSERADFSTVAKPSRPEEQLFISDLFHKAFVRVDEHGTEAAAATAAVDDGCGEPSEVEEFNADHPFLFFIVDARTDLILFMGRVVEP